MKIFSISPLLCVAASAAAVGLSSPTLAQDYNYVPGWANTTNHEYRNENDGEWKAKTDLFKQLSQRGPAARCTLQNLSEADGNVIVNQFRSRERKSNTATALAAAHQQVDAHHKRLRAQGKCQ